MSANTRIEALIKLKYSAYTDLLISLQKAVLLPLSTDLHLEPSEHDVNTAIQAVQLLEVQYNMQEARQLDDSHGL